jgi:hypothetical protein
MVSKDFHKEHKGTTITKVFSEKSFCVLRAFVFFVEKEADER